MLPREPQATRQQLRSSKFPLEHIVILGSGFGGWYAARHLAQTLPPGHRVTLIDQVGHMLYTPMLTEVAGGTVRGQDIAVPSSGLPSRVRFVKAEITAVDTNSKTVTLENGEILQATQLVIALGSTTSYHSIDGARENSLPLKTLADAERIADELDQLVADAAALPNQEERRFSLIVAGGGYTGVEAMAALNLRMREQAKLHGLQQHHLTATLIEPNKRLMQEMPEALAAYSKGELEADGVDVRLGISVKSVEQGNVELSTGERLPASLLLWDTGIEPSPLTGKMSLPLGKHKGILVNACLQVLGHSDIWAIGDCAEIPQPDGKGSYAPTAQNATREGVHLARNINGMIRNRPLRPFRFEMLGQLALISKRNAIAEVLGVSVRGVLAWAMWWVIYTAKLPTTLRKLSLLRTLASKQVFSLSRECMKGTGSAKRLSA